MLTQSFVYTCSGGDGSNFLVTLPTARADDDYLVTASLGGVTNLFALDLPDIDAGDRTTTEFRVVTSAPVQVGDKIEFQIYDLASSTLALHPFGSIVGSNWAPHAGGYMVSSSSGGFYMPIPLKQGDRIKSLTFDAYGTGMGHNLTMTVYVYSSAAGKVSIGGTTLINPAASWGNTALALTPTALAAGESAYIDFFGAASLMRIGTCRVGYDRL